MCDWGRPGPLGTTGCSEKQAELEPLVHYSAGNFVVVFVVFSWNSCRTKYVQKFVIFEISDQKYQKRKPIDKSCAVVRFKEHQDAIFMKLLPPGATGTLVDQISASYVKLVPTVESTGLRMKVLRGAGTAHEVFIADVTDPSEVRADVQGKLVRYLINEGDSIEEHQVICELEAMKMIVPVKSRSAGLVKSLEKSANSVVTTGDLLIRLDLSTGGTSGGEIRKWASVAKDKGVLFSAISNKRCEEIVGCEEKLVKQSSNAALRGFPRIGQLRIPSTVDQAAALLWDFLEFEAPFQPEEAEKPPPTGEAVLQKLLKSIPPTASRISSTGSATLSSAASGRNSATVGGGGDSSEAGSLGQLYTVFACRAAFATRLAAALAVVKNFGAELASEKPELVRALSGLGENYGELVLLCSRLAGEEEMRKDAGRALKEGGVWLERCRSSSKMNGSGGPRSSSGLPTPSVATLLKLARTLDNNKQTALEQLVWQFYRGFDSLRVTSCSSNGGGVHPEGVAATAAVRWEFMFHHQGLSGYGVPNKRLGIALSVSSLDALPELLKSTECSEIVRATVGGTGGAAPAGLMDGGGQFVIRSGSATGRSTPAGAGGAFLPMGGTATPGGPPPLKEAGVSGKPLDELLLVLDAPLESDLHVGRTIGKSLNSQVAATLFNTFDVRHITVVCAAGGRDSLSATTKLLHFIPSSALEIVETPFAPSPLDTPNQTPRKHQNVATLLERTGSLGAHSTTSNHPGSSPPAHHQHHPVVIAHRVYEEDSLLRGRVPTYAHLVQLTPQLRENAERIGPEQSTDALVLLKKDTLHVRAVSYLETEKSKIPQPSAEIDDPLAAFFPSVLAAAPAHEDDEDFHLLLEGSLRAALEELARVRLDPRTVGKRDAAKISLRLVARAALGPRTLFANYKSLVLTAMSGPVLQRLLRYRVDSVEFRFRLSGGEQVRLEASSHGGEYLKPSAFLDQLNPMTGEIERSMDLAKMLPGVEMMGAAGGGSGLDIENALQFEKAAADLAKKRTAAHRAGSTYLYDFPHLFRITLLRDLPKNEQKDAFVATELVFRGGSTSAGGGSKDSSSDGSFAALAPHARVLGEVDEQCGILGKKLGKVKLEPVQRPIGQNSVGMVVWLCTFKTSQYPGGRCMVLIANDITHQAGSFGVKEDDLYARASKLARSLGLPRIYISANSGARVGLVPKLEEKLKPAFLFAPGTTNDASRLPTGFEYWYVDSEEDLAAIKELVETEPVPEKPGRHRVTAVVGGSGIGVENLKGSALIAGETSRAYQETFTLSFVTGRSVGIGAYVNRLGQRVIQQRQGPMILTGFSALNKLLGREVYTSQDQLGGPQIMCPNGVTHLLVESDQEGVKQILKWLSFVPARQGAMPVPLGHVSSEGTTINLPRPRKKEGSAITSAAAPTASSPSGRGGSPPDLRITNSSSNCSQSDEEDLLLHSIQRPVTFLPTADAPYDVRAMLDTAAGSGNTLEEEDREPLHGFFDCGSFTEVFVEWGKTVIAGRARLGGFPVGVIAVETNCVARVIPADPANQTSQVIEEQQAGQVWFPDSAFKTAQCIRDFENEGLPLMIFANWRGFSGGTRDMFSEILKFGAQIVDALVDYTFPIFVYMPPGAELRGGAWVVVDPAINPVVMEMYASSQSRGGILEPTGIVDVKFRDAQMKAMMRRCDPVLRDHTSGATALTPAVLAKREQTLLPLYRAMAVEFADLHDRAARMKKVGCIRDIVEFETARARFARMRWNPVGPSATVVP